MELAGEINLHATGASKINLNVKAPKIAAEASGASTINSSLNVTGAIVNTSTTTIYIPISTTIYIQKR